MTTKKKKRKRKQKAGTIAIPFLITFLISLIVIGLPTIYLYNYLTTDTLASDSDNKGNEFTPKLSDSKTILFTLDPNDDEYLNCFMLLRSIPYTRTFVVLPVANNMYLESQGKTVDAVYTATGMNKLKASLEEELSISIDHYMFFRDEGFEKLCDIIGCAHYTLPSGLKGFNPGSQFISSDGINHLITHYAFNTEEQRMTLAGSVIAQMINEAMGDRVAGNLDNSFNSVYALCETDITSIDFNNGKSAIVYMFADDKYSAQFRNLTGQWDENKIQHISDADIAELHDWFDINPDYGNSED